MKEKKYIPNYLGVAKFFFACLCLITVGKLIGACSNIIWAVVTPNSSIKITNTGDLLGFRGFIAATKLPYDYLGISGMNISVGSAKLFCISTSITLLLLMVAPVVFMLISGFQIIKSITATYTPFTPHMIKLLRRLAAIMIAYGLFSHMLIQMTITIINFSTMPPDTDYTRVEDWSYVIAGVMVLIVSEVFRKGYDLQEEIDTTI